MKHRNYLLFPGLVIALYAITLVPSGCAQIGMPTGGFKDTLPPIILNINPPENTVNFKGNRITLLLDEYVHLEDVQNNLLVSPVPKINPNIDYKLKTVTIKLRDTLKENTTYKIELGNSVRDINENNPIQNFQYVFSTGKYIDSLTFSGNVEVAETGQADSTLYVFLYDDLTDSAVFKHKPKYVTRVNNKGDFTFSNLPPATYHVFALKDESGQRIYSNKTALFAFSDSAIQVGGETKPVKLYAYEEEKEKPKTSTSTAKTAPELKFAPSLSGGLQDLLSPLELVFNRPLKNINENAIRLSDTLFNPLPFKISLADTDTLHKTVTLQTNWTENNFYKLIIDSTFATDTSGLSLVKNDTLSFKTKKEGEYGSIKIAFQNLEKFKHPVLQFVKNKVVFKAYPLAGPSFLEKLFEPGDYEIRILEDDNQNGLWDPGYYDPANKALQKQPEKVISIPQVLNIKAGWDNERDIIL